MAVEYEDTVQPEIAPCVDCGILVDEADAEWDGDDRRCDGCAVEHGVVVTGLPEADVRKAMGLTDA